MNYIVLESLYDGVSGVYEGQFEYYYPEAFIYIFKVYIDVFPS